MDGTAVVAIEALAEKAAGKLVEIGGVTFSTKTLHEVRKAEPVCEVVGLRTLAGLAGLVASLLDAEAIKNKAEGLAVHVVDHMTVRVMAVGLEGRFRQREVYGLAAFEPLTGGVFRFGEFIPAENFIVGLQAGFVDKGDRAKVLALVGNISDEKVVNAADDGTTQTVTGRAGIVTRAEVSVPNPVKLSPFRTFREIEQPESAFILRLQKGRQPGELPSAALFEADGGTWKLTAIELIAAWLKAKLPKGVTVIA